MKSLHYYLPTYLIMMMIERRTRVQSWVGKRALEVGWHDDDVDDDDQQKEVQGKSLMMMLMMSPSYLFLLVLLRCWLEDDAADADDA